MAKQPIYDPKIFDRDLIEDAKRIILTVPPDMLEDYWKRATVATADLILDGLKPTPDSVLLDFGCGIGRLAKEIIGRIGCTIIGVDISASMRRQAIEHVDSERFSVLSADVFGRLAADGVTLFSGAYSVVVLQHTLDPEAEIRRIAATCAAEAPVLIYNHAQRLVPTNKGWASDGKDVGKLAAEIFRFLREYELPRDCLLYPERGALPGEIESHWLRLFQNRGDARG